MISTFYFIFVDGFVSSIGKFVKKSVQDQHNNNLAIIYFFDQELEDDLPDNYHNTTERRTNVNGNDLDIKETIDKTTSDDRSERN